MQSMNKADIWRHILQTPRHAHRFPHVIIPTAVYADPVYPTCAVIVEMPFDLPFRCESVFWYTSKLARRYGVLRSDLVGYFGVMSTATSEGRPLCHVVFFAEELFLLFKKWIYFVKPQPRGIVAKNLLKAYYTVNPIPPLLNRYDAAVIHYGSGGIFADHPHLRKVVCRK